MSQSVVIPLAAVVLLVLLAAAVLLARRPAAARWVESLFRRPPREPRRPGRDHYYRPYWS